MRKTELILGTLAIIGLLLKVFMIVGADILLTISLTALAFYYFLFGFTAIHGIPFRKAFRKDSYQGISALAIIGSIALGWSLSIVLLGILFKLLFLPGGLTQLSLGLACLLLVFLVVILKYFTNRKEYLKKALLRTLIGLALGTLLWVTPNNRLVDLLFFTNPEYAETFKEYLENPENEELAKKLEDLKYPD